MKATEGWLVDARGQRLRAQRFRFGAVPAGRGPNLQVSTLLDIEVAGAALPGIWAAVICIYAGIARSALWFLAVPVALLVAWMGVNLLAIMRSRTLAREMRPSFRFTPAASLCAANAHLQAAAESLVVAPSRASSKAWNSLNRVAADLTHVALAVDAADEQIATLHSAHLDGLMSMDEYRVRAWEPWVRANPQRDALARFTRQCRELEATSRARSNVAAMRTGTPRVIGNPLVTAGPVGTHLSDLLG